MPTPPWVAPDQRIPICLCHVYVRVCFQGGGFALKQLEVKEGRGYHVKEASSVNPKVLEKIDASEMLWKSNDRISTPVWSCHHILHLLLPLFKRVCRSFHFLSDADHFFMLQVHFRNEKTTAKLSIRERDVLFSFKFFCICWWVTEMIDARSILGKHILLAGQLSCGKS